MKRLLVIVNPYATTVSDRLKNLVVHALRGSFAVDAVDTERREHATELCRQAAATGTYDAVLAFGGDGTVNEAANGLVGSDLPLMILPGGRVNVFCRLLGLPGDVVDATEPVLGLADVWHPRPVDLGVANGRFFLVNSGFGLDAAVVERVDAHPARKARLGDYYYAWASTSIFSSRYLVRPPRLSVTLPGGEQVGGVTLIVQNARPYTYFGERPVELAADVAVDSGDLAGIVLRETTPLAVPTIAWRMLSRNAQIGDHRQITAFDSADGLTAHAEGDVPIPLQVDGDYIGDFTRVSYSVLPGGLSVLT